MDSALTTRPTVRSSTDANHGPPAITVSQLRMTYGDTVAVDDLSFAVYQDEGLVEAESTEAGEVDGVGAVAAALFIIVKGGHGHVQLGHEVGFCGRP